MAYKICVVLVLSIFCLLGSISAVRSDAAGPVITPLAVPTPETKSETFSPKMAFRGVSVGMLAEEVRKILGEPKEKSDAQDFYVFSDDVSGQVYYDPKHAVSAVSIDFMGKKDAPAPKEVLGVDLTAKADGSMYDIIRFPKAGYWISYNRTAGNDAMVSITMQKLP